MQSLSMLQRWKVCEHVRLRHAKSKMRYFHFLEKKMQTEIFPPAG